MAKHQPLLCLCPNLPSSPNGEITIATLFYPNLSSSPNGKTSTASLFYPNLLSSPDGEISTATLLCPDLYLFAEWRNDNRCFVLPESLFLRRMAK